MKTDITNYKGYKIVTNHKTETMNTSLVYDVLDHSNLLKGFHVEQTEKIRGNSVDKAKCFIDELIVKTVCKMTDEQLDDIYYNTIGYYPFQEGMSRGGVIEVLVTYPEKLTIASIHLYGVTSF